jgi:hypothetical protein
MKVQCPQCATQVPAANMSLEAGWGKCEACQEVFPLAEVVPGFPAPGTWLGRPVERPFDARAVVERSARELQVDIPAEGMRAATFTMLGFATFWLAFIAFWTAGALGMFWGGHRTTANWLFASFSIPFWLVGIGMLGGVAWNLWGTKSVRIDQNGMTTYQRCLVWSRSRWVELDRVQHARHYDAPVKGSGHATIPHAVEIVYRSGSFVLPADSGEEERWLIAEINDVVKSLAA